MSMIHFYIDSNRGSLFLKEVKNMFKGQKVYLILSSVSVHLQGTHYLSNSNQIYFRSSLFAPCINSNLSSFGIPIHVSSADTVYTPNLKILLGTNIQENVEYFITDRNGTLVDFSNLRFIELVFYLDFYE